MPMGKDTSTFIIQMCMLTYAYGCKNVDSILQRLVP